MLLWCASDTAGRFGGEDFGLLLSELAGLGGAYRVAQDCVAALCESFDLCDERFDIGTSIGIAYSPNDGHTAEQLPATADRVTSESQRCGASVPRRDRARHPWLSQITRTDARSGRGRGTRSRPTNPRHRRCR
ncbi:diguanylate cyclase domain-containing protein [Thioflavicoccus mobilis]|uniref:diguanylate cyclase domain-containing protein n=1 Tax=Thioflavicoccus mobilis TaxID=80679 RepID=UPI003CCB77E9